MCTPFTRHGYTGRHDGQPTGMANKTSVHGRMNVCTTTASQTTQPGNMNDPHKQTQRETMHGCARCDDTNIVVVMLKLADRNGRRTQDMRAPVQTLTVGVHALVHPACVLMHMSGRAGLGRDHSASFSWHIRLRPFRPCERAGSVRVSEKPDAAWSTSPWASLHVQSNTYTHAANTHGQHGVCACTDQRMYHQSE